MGIVRHSCWVFSAAVAAASGASGAQAQSALNPASPTYLVSQICLGNAGTSVSRGRVIAAAYAVNGRFVAEPASADQTAFIAASFAEFRRADGPAQPGDSAEARNSARDVRESLRALSRHVVSLTQADDPPIRFTGSTVRSADEPLLLWLAGLQDADAQLICAPLPGTPDRPAWRPFGDTMTPALRLRGSIAGLSAMSDELATTDAARFSVTRTIERQDDGSDKRSTALTLDAFLGLRLLPANGPDQVILFGGIDRDRTRVSPRPAAGQSAETNLRYVGVRLHHQTNSADEIDPAGGGRSDFYAANLLYVHDRTADSQLLRVDATWRPGLDTVVAPCRFGSFTRGAALQSRCAISLEASAADIIERGTGAFRFTGAYAALGARFEYELQFATPQIQGRLETGGGPFLRVIQLYQAVVGGRGLDDIHRIDATLGYRAFVINGLGVEVSGTLAYGTNTETLARERRLVVGAGIIF